MSTKESPTSNENTIQPEQYYAGEIAEGLRNLVEFNQLVLRGEKPASKLDALRDRLHALLDEAIGQMEWLAKKNEFGDSDPGRFTSDPTALK